MYVPSTYTCSIVLIQKRNIRLPTVFKDAARSTNTQQSFRTDLLVECTRYRDVANFNMKLDKDKKERTQIPRELLCESSVLSQETKELLQIKHTRHPPANIMSTANWDRSLGRSLDTTLDLFSATTTRATERDGGGPRQQPTTGDTTTSSSNPYKRRALLPRRSTDKGKSGDTFFDALEEEESILSIGPVRSSGGNRNKTMVGVHDGNNPSTDARAPFQSHRYRSSPPSSSRSVSPNRSPWYPPGRRPSPDSCLQIANGDGDEPARRKKAAENAYVLHPAYRHMFERAERGTSPRTTQHRLEDGWGAGDSAGRRDIMISAPVNSAKERAPSNRHDRSATRDLRRVTGRRDSRERQTPLSPRHSKDGTLTNVPAKPKNARHTRCQGGEKGNNIASRSGEARGGHRREKVAAIRRRVRGLQDVGKGRQPGVTPPASGHGQKNSTRDRRTNPGSRSSTVFTGHEGQILALAHHEDILFSAAADGTAKVSPINLTVVALTSQACHRDR